MGSCAEALTNKTDVYNLQERIPKTIICKCIMNSLKKKFSCLTSLKQAAKYSSKVHYVAALDPPIGIIYGSLVFTHYPSHVPTSSGCWRLICEEHSSTLKSPPPYQTNPPTHTSVGPQEEVSLALSALFCLYTQYPIAAAGSGPGVCCCRTAYPFWSARAIKLSSSLIRLCTTLTVPQRWQQRSPPFNSFHMHQLLHYNAKC